MEKIDKFLNSKISTSIKQNYIKALEDEEFGRLITQYKIYEEVHFAFSEKNNKLEETNRIKNDNVLCSNCNKFINNANTNFLENLCSINHCKKCGKDLTEIGINEKINMSFNEESNKFDKKEKTYNCVSCDEELSKHQIEYFKL